ARSLGYVGDSQISCRVIHGQSALRRADPCSALDCETTSGTRSRIFCPGVKGMSVVPQRTTDCLWKPFFTDTGRGVICPCALVIGKWCTSGLADGQKAAFSSAFLSCWPAITITNT